MRSLEEAKLDQLREKHRCLVKLVKRTVIDVKKPLFFNLFDDEDYYFLSLEKFNFLCEKVDLDPEEILEFKGCYTWRKSDLFSKNYFYAESFIAENHSDYVKFAITSLSLFSWNSYKEIR